LTELDLPDPRSLSEPVDIVVKFPSNLQANLTSSKWKERKEVLDDLFTLVNATPRIQDAPELAELAKSLATCIHKDANINCVITAANVMEGLAKGMMGPFGRLREAVVPPMLERLKERKTNVTDAIGAALDAVFTTVSILSIFYLISLRDCDSADISARHNTRPAPSARKQKSPGEGRDSEVPCTLSCNFDKSSVTGADQITH